MLQKALMPDVYGKHCDLIPTNVNLTPKEQTSINKQAYLTAHLYNLI